MIWNKQTNKQTHKCELINSSPKTSTDSRLRPSVHKQLTERNCRIAQVIHSVFGDVKNMKMINFMEIYEFIK